MDPEDLKPWLQDLNSAYARWQRTRLEKTPADEVEARRVEVLRVAFEFAGFVKASKPKKGLFG